MKLQLESSDANVVRAWERGAIRVGEEWIRGHVIVSATRLLRDWTVTSPGALQVADLQPAIDLGPQIILLGTGNELILPDADLMGAVAQQRIGLEIMDTPAACRTYNVLVHERRAVVAALFNAL